MVGGEETRQALQLVHDQFRADALAYPPLSCHLFQGDLTEDGKRDCGNESEVLQEVTGCYCYPVHGRWRAVYFDESGSYSISPSAVMGEPGWQVFGTGDRPYGTSKKGHPTGFSLVGGPAQLSLIGRYDSRAAHAGQLLEQLAPAVSRQFARSDHSALTWTWALFDWSFSLPRDDPRFVDRVCQCGGPSPSTGGQPSDGITSSISDVLSKSVEFTLWLMEQVAPHSGRTGSAPSPPQQTANASSEGGQGYLDMTVNTEERTVTRHGKMASIEGSKRAWDLFRALYNAGASGLTRKQIHKQVWKNQKVEDSNLDKQKASLNDYLRHLRVEVVADKRGVWRLLPLDSHD